MEAVDLSIEVDKDIDELTKDESLKKIKLRNYSKGKKAKQNSVKNNKCKYSNCHKSYSVVSELYKHVKKDHLGKKISGNTNQVKKSSNNRKAKELNINVKTSARLWKHFKKKKQGLLIVGECNHCKKSFNYIKGNSDFMKSHLKLEHGIDDVDNNSLKERNTVVNSNFIDVSSSPKFNSVVWKYFKRNELGAAKCNQCEKTFKFISGGCTTILREHLIRKHGIELEIKSKKPFWKHFKRKKLGFGECNHCKKNYNYINGTMKSHLKLKHGIGDLDDSLKGEETINADQMENNPKEHKDCKCESCCKSFIQANNLKARVTTIHEGHKNNKCKYCGKSFPHAQNMKRHIHTIHNGHKDYKCKIESCGKLFSQAVHLKKHIYRIHEGYKDYKSETTNVDEVNNEHKNMSHEEIEVDRNDSQSQFFSEVQFSSQSNINNMHKCSQCKKIFHSSQELGEHKCIVEEILKSEKFKCNICDEKFAFDSLLEIHQRVKHKDHNFKIGNFPLKDPYNKSSNNGINKEISVSIKSKENPVISSKPNEEIEILPDESKIISTNLDDNSVHEGLKEYTCKQTYLPIIPMIPINEGQNKEKYLNETERESQKCSENVEQSKQTNNSHFDELIKDIENAIEENTIENDVNITAEIEKLFDLSFENKQKADDNELRNTKQSSYDQDIMGSKQTAVVKPNEPNKVGKKNNSNKENDNKSDNDNDIFENDSTSNKNIEFVNLSDEEEYSITENKLSTQTDDKSVQEGLKEIEIKFKCKSYNCEKSYLSKESLKSHIKTAHDRRPIPQEKSSDFQLTKSKPTADHNEFRKLKSKQIIEIVDLSDDEDNKNTEKLPALNEAENQIMPNVINKSDNDKKIVDLSENEGKITEKLQMNETEKQIMPKSMNKSDNDNEISKQETMNKKYMKQIVNTEMENIDDHSKSPNTIGNNWNCSQCDSNFKNKKKLINHVQKIKLNVPVKRCMICPFKSCTRIGILSHMEKSHIRSK